MNQVNYRPQVMQIFLHLHLLSILLFSFNPSISLKINIFSSNFLSGKFSSEKDNLQFKDQIEIRRSDGETVLNQLEPTKTPRPTRTPLTIPPPQNETQTNLMIMFMALAVVVVIIGVWLNRERKRS